MKPILSAPSSPRSANRALRHAWSKAAIAKRAILEEALPGVGEFGAARISLEQAHAKLPLQRRDLPRQRRLADVQALGGAAEMQRFGQRHEIAHLAQVNHDDTEQVLIAP